MENRKYRQSSNFKFKDCDKEKVQGASVTVPGQSYTVSELLERHIQGNMPSVGREGYYEDDPSFDNIDPTQAPDFDLVDATIINDELNHKIEADKKLKEDKILEEKKIKEQKLKMYEETDKKTTEKKAIEEKAKNNVVEKSEPSA